MTAPISAIVFAGPTLWGLDRPIPAGIEIRPPAACGDVLRAARERPCAIGLIDGVFEAGPSVWHKEILLALAQGVTVVGAASLGALRAAELHRFGMAGVGAVFAAYRDGRIERDDAVMVSHAPAALGHRPLTVALVDVEAATAGWPAIDRMAMARIAARINFRDRNWDALSAAFQSVAGRAMPAVDREYSLKRQDAALLIERLAAGAIMPPAAVASPPETRWLRALREG